MISGYSCFEKHPGTYGCMDGCNKTHGYTCQMPHGVVPLVEVKDHANTDVTLYCMSVYRRHRIPKGKFGVAVVTVTVSAEG